MPAFEKEEYDIRLAKVRKSMDEKNIEVLIVTDPSNMSWLTGYDGWSFYVHQCVVLTLEGNHFGTAAGWMQMAQREPCSCRMKILSGMLMILYKIRVSIQWIT